MIKIAPSILSADFSKLGSDVEAADKGGADYIHVDVMDGHFVPNITIGPLVVKSLRKITKKPLDTHLMITDPEKYIPRFAEAGSDYLTVHIETCPDILRTIKLIKSLNVKAGLTLNPATPFDTLLPALEHIDLLLIMTVQPGFGAQSFMENQLSKIERARDEKERGGFKYEIEVDGGINMETIKRVNSAGGEVMVAGNAVFGKGTIAENIRLLKEIA
ncbi:MAG: ribulose-phosphate 3-epimerase [Fibrobacteres bacterium]|nr:ribulose-phosphate 3-epimerase [Fibrobacterota bacterium]